MNAKIASAALVLTLACAGPSQNLAPAGVEIFTEDAKIVELSLTSLELALPYEVQNKGAAPVTLDAIDWKLSIPGEIDTAGTTAPALSVAGGQSNAGVLSITVALDTSDGAYARRVEGPGTATYSIGATFKIAGNEYQASWVGDMLLPKRPSVEASAQATRNEQQVEAHFILRIKNPNPFALPVERLEYVISLEGIELERGTLATNHKVAQGSEVEFDVSKSVETKTVGQKSLRYQVETTLVAAGQSFAAPLEGSIDFAR